MAIECPPQQVEVVENPENNANVEPGYHVTDGAEVWNSPADMHAGSVTVICIGDRDNPPTLTTPNGSGPLFQTQTVSYGTHYNDNPYAAGDIVVTTGPGDVVAINWDQEV